MNSRSDPCGELHLFLQHLLRTSRKQRKDCKEVMRIHRSLKRRLGPDRVCDTSDPRLKKGRVGEQLNSGVSLE